MTLNFSDGVQIDTSGELRKLRLQDGLYVVGQGYCIPVANDIEAEKMIESLKIGS